ncbi:MAG: histidinol dehydrogenase [Hyphomonadaceae bacterium]
MKRYDWSALSADEQAKVLARPEHRVAADVSDTVRRIFAEVEAEGEAALKRWARALDGVEPYALELTAEVVNAARATLSDDEIEAIEFAVDQVRFYHEATKPKMQAVETAPGVLSRRVWRAIETCGLYVPGGGAPLVSTLIMLAEPARVAGVPNRVVVTPPGKDGKANPALIVGAAACGLERIWVIGGAQAIAALTYGVMTPKAQKIFGPGNAYVAEAKRYAAGLPNGPAMDLPAGPSELMVIADAAADPRFVAADLLSQAEHDADAQVILVSTSDEALSAAEAEVQRQLADLPRKEIAGRSLDYARSIRVQSEAEAVALANLYAPEHLSLQIAQPQTALEGIVNAGAVFVGAFCAETLGDYVVGPSHVLPTDAAGKAFSGVSVASFMKSFAVQEVDAAGLRALAPRAAKLARLEGLEAHARAADVRLAALDAANAPRDATPVTRRRRAAVVRETKETKIDVRVDLDATGPTKIETGVGFYDHMLEQIAHHGGFSLQLKCDGDLHIDTHHTIEDCALAFGQALREALGERRGIARFGFVLPMDETEASVSIDLGGRAYLVFDAAFDAPALGEYPTEMTEHVFRSLSQAMAATIHVAVKGENDHHKTEACFKAFGRAMRQAIRIEGQDTPSTKGVI